MAATHTVTIVLMTVLFVDVNAQFYDLFQGLQPYIQSQTNSQHQKHTDTTSRVTNQRNKQNNRQETTRRYDVDIPFSFIGDSSERERARQREKSRKTTQANFYTTPRTTKKTNKNSSRNNSSSNSKLTEASNVNSNYGRRNSGLLDDGNINFIEYTTKPNRNHNKADGNDYKVNNYDYNYSYDNAQPSYENGKNNRGVNSNYYTTRDPFNADGVRSSVADGSPPRTNRPATVRPSFGFGSADEDPAPELLKGPDEDAMGGVEKRRYIEIAEKMCDKYKMLSIKQLQAIPLVPSPQPVNVNVSSCTPTNVPLVVGGKVVSIKEFPHMALLGWPKLKDRGYSWKCGGSLVSDKYVLTAAHCTYYDRDNSVVAGPPRVVQLGSSYRDGPTAKVVKISSITRHPKYISPVSYYDLAVVKLVTAVRFNDVIKPACLGVPPSIGKSVIATGWGRTEYGGEQSQELRSVSLPLWNMDECRNVLGVSRRIPDGPSRENQVCAGERSGGKDTCQGDSGGPVQIQDGCLWRVVGVTSLGRSCGAAYTPGVYSVVSRAFIAAVVFGNNKDNNNNYNYESDNRRSNTNSYNRDGDENNYNYETSVSNRRGSVDSRDNNPDVNNYRNISERDFYSRNRGDGNQRGNSEIKNSYDNNNYNYETSISNLRGSVSSRDNNPDVNNHRTVNERGYYEGGNRRGNTENSNSYENNNYNYDTYSQRGRNNNQRIWWTKR